MNTVAILLLGIACLLSLSTTTAFSPAPHQTTHRRTTHLNSIIIEPSPEDSCEVDSTNCEESIWDRHAAEQAEYNQAVKDKYRTEQGIELTDVDLMETVDQYQNSPTGGNLIGGVALTALCEDD